MTSEGHKLPSGTALHEGSVPISHTEVRRHPLWRQELATPPRPYTGRRPLSRLVWTALLVALIAAIYLLVTASETS
jgi:hypothetical protein